MRVAALSEELEGEVVARPVCTASGQVLVGAGVTLTRSLIARLSERGFTRVAIRDWLLDDVAIDDAVCEETRAMATRAVYTVLEGVARGERPDPGKVAEVVRAVIWELRQSADVVLSLSALRCHDDYTCVHSVNVCILAGVLGIAMGLPDGELTDLALGAILHDLGKIRVPRPMLGKPGPLGEEEWVQVKAHPMEGYHLMVRCVGSGYLAAHAALDHHERLNGSGYPRGLTGREITLIGRMVAIADVFDAMTSDRVYRCRVPPHLCLAHLREQRGELYDASLVDRFCERIAPYPVGSLVRLSTGELAAVVGCEAGNLSSPRVRLVSDSEFRPITPREIDLAAVPGVTVVEALDDYPHAFRQRIRPACPAPS
ncbi:MAG: HD-GYP domain-containing protein [Bacillota bacterium]|nr:HD-GYP domain-containing protein [Bacillota bacterium]